MLQVGVLGQSHQITQVGSHGFVKVFRQVCVHIHVIMRVMGSCRGTYVLTALWGVGNLTTLKKIVISKNRQKRSGSCSSLGWSSCRNASVVENGDGLNSKSNTTVERVKSTTYMARFFYNSAVRPRDIDNLLAKKPKNVLSSSKTVVKTRIFGRGVNTSAYISTNSVTNKKSNGQCKLSCSPVVQPQWHSHSPKREYRNNVPCKMVQDTASDSAQGSNLDEWQHTHLENPSGVVMGLNPTNHNDKVLGTNLTSHTKKNVVSDDSVGGGRFLPGHNIHRENNPGKDMGLNPINHSDKVSGSNLVIHNSVNSISNDTAGGGGLLPIYDVNSGGVEEKFANSILHFKQFNESNISMVVDSPIFKKWSEQSDFQFGFIPLGDQLIPTQFSQNNLSNGSLIDAHYVIRQTGKPNFLGARIPVTSQLNVDKWEELLQGYWDQQLLQLLRFGFPLDFNRSCPLQSEKGNHTSATQFPLDVDAYIEEECGHGALLGPFKENLIANCHTSPFMTRNKPNSDRHRVIIDLSWPIGASVNAGIDKDTYLNSPFALTFPTVDDITSQLRCLGRGALLYKIDVSRAFRHVRMDPGDFDLLGLQWRDAYIDACLKCVKPARAFLNRMLALLRSGHAAQKNILTPEFKRDLKWFDKFLPLYNGVSLYDHRPIDHTLELDACLTGLGGRWCNFVYHMPICQRYMNWSIVHLEMVNVLLAVRLFQASGQVEKF